MPLFTRICELQNPSKMGADNIPCHGAHEEDEAVEIWEYCSSINKVQAQVLRNFRVRGC